jgi:hypothetical protein
MVGYKDPPKHTRFGQPGIKCGKPMGRPNFETVMNEVLEETTTIVDENGKEKTVTRRQAMAIKLYKTAMNSLKEEVTINGSKVVKDWADGPGKQVTENVNLNVESAFDDENIKDAVEKDLNDFILQRAEEIKNEQSNT